MEKVFEKIDSLTKNTEVTILGEEDGWYKVETKTAWPYSSEGIDFMNIVDGFGFFFFK